MGCGLGWGGVGGWVGGRTGMAASTATLRRPAWWAKRRENVAVASMVFGGGLVAWGWVWLGVEDACVGLWLGDDWTVCCLLCPVARPAPCVGGVGGWRREDEKMLVPWVEVGVGGGGLAWACGCHWVRVMRANQTRFADEKPLEGTRVLCNFNSSLPCGRRGGLFTSGTSRCSRFFGCLFCHQACTDGNAGAGTGTRRPPVRHQP